MVDQQRTNLADVAYLDLEAIDNLIEKNKGVKHYFPRQNNPALFQLAYRGAGYVKKEGESHHGQPSELKDGGAAYGAGTYFSSRKAVGRAYADRPNAITKFTLDGINYSHTDKLPLEVAQAVEFMRTERGNKEFAKKYLEQISKHEKSLDKEKISVIIDKIEDFDMGRHLYQADIDDEALADWDKPLKEQPKILEVIKKLILPFSIEELSKQGLLEPNDDFGTAYAHLTRKFGGDKEAASAALAKAGIPGHTYMGEYRNAGEGKDVPNYVIYDDSAIRNEKMLFSLKETGGTSADNGGMTAEKRQEYEAFVKGAWTAAVNHKPGQGEIPQNEFVFLKEPNGVWHITGAQPARHIYKQHGDVKTEKMRGQIAITEKDFLLIPDIISNYSYSLENIKYLNKNSVLYAKHDDDGTHVYIEQISNKRRRKTTATFFKLAKQREAQNLLTILGNNANYDIKNALITGLGGGGNPPDTTGHDTRRTAATSVNPADASLSANPAEKSSPRPFPFA